MKVIILLLTSYSAWAGAYHNGEFWQLIKDSFPQHQFTMPDLCPNGYPPISHEGTSSQDYGCSEILPGDGFYSSSYLKGRLVSYARIERGYQRDVNFGFLWYPRNESGVYIGAGNESDSYVFIHFYDSGVVKRYQFNPLLPKSLLRKPNYDKRLRQKFSAEIKAFMDSTIMLLENVCKDRKHKMTCAALAEFKKLPSL